MFGRPRPLYPLVLLLAPTLLTSPTTRLSSSADACIAPSFRPAPVYDVGKNPRSVAVGDFNGDGKQDLAAGNAGSGTVSILLNDGAGAFSQSRNFLVGKFPNSVAAGDFNRDGRLDLVTSNVDLTVTLLVGDGSGGFAAPSSVTVTPSAIFVTTGDFNADGNLDLAMADNLSSIWILLGNGRGGFGAPARTIIGRQPSFIAVGDFNGDGRPDLAVAVIAINSAEHVRILFGDGAGGFGPPNGVGVRMGGSGSRSIAISDFNGDGKQDLAVANVLSGNVSVVLGDGTGGFGAPTNLSVDVLGPYAVAAADFNGDGKTDVATADVAIFLGDGTGGFRAASYFGVGRFPRSIGVGDFNGDGKTDLAIGASGGRIVILLGRGTGTFGAPTFYGANLGGSQSVATADVNGDGKPDLVATNPGTGTISILLGDGKGSFGEGTTFAVGPGPQNLAIADFNGDGKLDVATANLGFPGQNMSVLLGDGQGRFGTAANFPAGSNPRDIASGDLNGDGSNDLVVANSSNVLSVFFNSCVATRVVYFPQIAVGGGFSTTFTLLNTGSATASGKLVLTDQSGNPLSTTLFDPRLTLETAVPKNGTYATRASLSFSVLPGATVAVRASAIDESIARSGWARVESTAGSLSGVSIFELVEGGALKTIAGVLASAAVEFATIPVDNDGSDNRFTGFAVANPGNEDINLRLVSLDEEGNIVDTVFPPELNPLGPQKQIARFIHEPGYLPARLKFKGSMVLIAHSAQKFAVTALVLKQGLLTAIPVILGKAPNVPN